MNNKSCISSTDRLGVFKFQLLKVLKRTKPGKHNKSNLAKHKLYDQDA